MVLATGPEQSQEEKIAEATKSMADRMYFLLYFSIYICD